MVSRGEWPIILPPNSVMHTQAVNQPTLVPGRNQAGVPNLYLGTSTRSYIETKYALIVTLLVRELFACTPWLS